MANKLLPGGRLQPGDRLTSDSNQYILVYQTDGNLVLYDQSLLPARWTWQSYTAGHTPGYVEFQKDGNLVIFDVANKPVRGVASAPLRPPVMAVLQDDGNFVIYGIAPVFDVWSDNQSRMVPVPAAGGGGYQRGVNINSVVETISAAESVIEVVASLF